MSQKAVTNLLSKQQLWFYDTSESVCLDINLTHWVIPKNTKVYLTGFWYKEFLEEIIVPRAQQSQEVLEVLLFNYETSSFRSVEYLDGSLKYTSETIAAYSLRNQMNINSEFYKINGVSFRKSINVSLPNLYAHRPLKTIEDSNELHISVISESGKWIIPAGIKFDLGSNIFTSVYTEVTFVPNVLSRLYYNPQNSSFKAANFPSEIPWNCYEIASGVRNSWNFCTRYLSANGVLLQNSVKTENLFSDNNSLIKSSILFDNNLLFTENYAKTSKALKNIVIYSNDNIYDYYIIAVKQASTANDMFIMFSFDKNGVRGEDIRLGTLNATWLETGIFYATVKVNKDEVHIVFDHANSGYFIDANNRNLKISQSRYFKKIINQTYSFEHRNFCSLGASTSTGAWLKDAVLRLGMNFRGFGVPGTRWGFLYDDEVLDYSGEINNNINMMNEVARLFKYADENPTYYPEVMTFFCGINGLGTMAAENWENAFLSEIDLSSLDPVKWFDSTTPLSWKKSYVISMRACLEFISVRFPLCQLIVMTPQLAAQFGYNTNKDMRDNLVGVAKRCSIPIIDFFYESGFNDVTKTDTVFSNDNLHPNDKGAIVFTNFLEQQLRSKIAFRK